MHCLVVGPQNTCQKILILFYPAKLVELEPSLTKGKLLCTLRINGSLAISIDFAQTLLQNKIFRENCIEINKDAAPFVMEGRSVFCKHVVWCGKNVRVCS